MLGTASGPTAAHLAILSIIVDLIDDKNAEYGNVTPSEVSAHSDCSLRPSTLYTYMAALAKYGYLRRTGARRGWGYGSAMWKTCFELTRKGRAEAARLA